MPAGWDLDWADTVLEEFSGWYCGKQSPVHLFWHGFDVAVTCFSGRRAPARDGADPSLVRPPPTRSSRSASGR
jgi:hypothetical protein